MRGNNLYCASPLPLFYIILDGIDKTIAVVGIVVLAYIAFVLIYKALKREPVLNQTRKALLITLLAAIIYFLGRLALLSILLPLYTDYSDYDFYTINYIFLSVIIIANLLVIKKFVTGHLSTWAKILFILAVMLLVFGIFATVARNKEASNPKLAASRTDNMFNPYALNNLPTLQSCSFKWY